MSNNLSKLLEEIRNKKTNGLSPPGAVVEQPTPPERKKTNLEDLAERIRLTLRDDFDLLTCVSGREGIGKSTMAYHLCKLVDPDFDLQKNIVYSLDELQDKIFNAPRYSAVLIDEGMEIFYKRDWWKGSRIDLLKVLAQARQQNLFYVFCTPRFTDLDELLRSWRCRLWIKMTDRGEGRLFHYDDRRDKGDPWNLDDFKEQRRENYWGSLNCPQFPQEEYEKYKQIKREYFLKSNSKKSEDDNSKSYYRLGLTWLYLHEKLSMSYAEIARALGLAPEIVRTCASKARRQRELEVHTPTGAERTRT